MCRETFLALLDLREDLFAALFSSGVLSVARSRVGGALDVGFSSRAARLFAERLPPPPWRRR